MELSIKAMEHELLSNFFFIFTGAAIFATILLYMRQMMIAAYLLAGILCGPAGFSLIQNTELIGDISHLGITFLLFLLGVDMSPIKLLESFKSTAYITVISSATFGGIGYFGAFLLDFNHIECIVLGLCMMFSSTIIGLKLLPTTVLHHQSTGGAIISILLLQDIFAIAVLLFLPILATASQASDEPFIVEAISTVLSLPVLILTAWLLYRFVIAKLLTRFDQFKEYIFLLTIGWCLGIAEMAEHLGLSREIGAFIAGIILASSPIAFYITEFLKPVRDFFLVCFFFSLGAGLQSETLDSVLIPAFVFAIIILAVKPSVFYLLLRTFYKEKKYSAEISFRLSQSSEFSLLIVVLALSLGLVRNEVAYLIQLATFITFILSPYLVVLRYPSPIAISDKLRRD
ncbi:MAG: cation:proton antiporter [Candidatus Oxydemutatoraceae bacterium WSBS_2016_MAG_OTU14]